MHQSYDYATFPYQGMAAEFASWISKLRVTCPAPDFEALLVDSDQTVRLSSFTREAPTVVEFGSLT